MKYALKTVSIVLLLAASIAFTACGGGGGGGSDDPETEKETVIGETGTDLGQVDMDGDGISDGTAIDVDGDGTPDGVDTNGDGKIDVEYSDDYVLVNDSESVIGETGTDLGLVDMDGDGVSDGTAIDTDGDGVPDGVDTNGDGKIDVGYSDDYVLVNDSESVIGETGTDLGPVDMDGDGVSDGIAIDVNGDGTPDGVDTDGDGTIDEIYSDDYVLSDYFEAGFEDAVNIKDQGTVAVGSETVTMSYANNLSTVTFPTGISDTATATIDKKFFMSETEVTNAVFKEVMQWAWDNGKFSTTPGAHNEVTAVDVNYGGKGLIYVTDSDCKIAFDASAGTFSVESGFEDHPVVYVSWYGAIMFCNWLTEMRDGNTDNVVYTGITIDIFYSWVHTETVEDAGKNGYRLPSSNEWEYAARYRGTDTVNTVTGTIDGTDFDAMAVKWTRGDSASGAVADYNDEAATRAVAWYREDPDMGANSRLMAVKGKLPNTLGLNDMSGNAWEWCYDVFIDVYRIIRGSEYDNSVGDAQVGYWHYYVPNRHINPIGFRFARTK